MVEGRRADRMMPYMGEDVMRRKRESLGGGQVYMDTHELLISVSVVPSQFDRKFVVISFSSQIRNADAASPVCTCPKVRALHNIEGELRPERFPAKAIS